MFDNKGWRKERGAKTNIFRASRHKNEGQKPTCFHKRDSHNLLFELQFDVMTIISNGAIFFQLNCLVFFDVDKMM